LQDAGVLANREKIGVVCTGSQCEEFSCFRCSPHPNVAHAVDVMRIAVLVMSAVYENRKKCNEAETAHHLDIVLDFDFTGFVESGNDPRDSRFRVDDVTRVSRAIAGLKRLHME